MTYQHQEPLLRRIIDALTPLAVRAVVTTGPAIDPVQFSAPPHILAVRSASHHALLPHCALVITHGGHGTVLRALHAGVPILCLPMGRDQADNGARLVAAGAGRCLSAHSRATTIQRAVTEALGDPVLHAGARRLAKRLSAEDGDDLAITELEALAGQTKAHERSS
jgi:UDP:flavonoid glycosyltransferase YjiC (YdhE family)